MVVSLVEETGFLGVCENFVELVSEEVNLTINLVESPRVVIFGVVVGAIANLLKGLPSLPRVGLRAGIRLRIWLGIGLRVGLRIGLRIGLRVRLWVRLRLGIRLRIRLGFSSLRAVGCSTAKLFTDTSLIVITGPD